MFRITISRSRKHPVKDELPLWVLKSRTTLFPKTRKNHLLQEHLFDNAIPFQKKGFTDTKGDCPSHVDLLPWIEEIKEEIIYNPF